jgi:hypothetical protein
VATINVDDQVELVYRIYEFDGDRSAYVEEEQRVSGTVIAADEFGVRVKDPVFDDRGGCLAPGIVGSAQDEHFFLPWSNVRAAWVTPPGDR